MINTTVFKAKSILILNQSKTTVNTVNVNFQ